MRILVMGGDGMLGHQLLESLQKNHDVRITVRQGAKAYQEYDLFNHESSYFNVDVRQDENIIPVLEHFKPHAVINAVGVIKQRQIGNDAISNIEINALFPHRLSRLCETAHARLIHFSTDCVFSGKKGKYTENDISDATDFYGKSKFLGEVAASHCLTLRTSVIGLELARKASLIEWFLAQQGIIKGYKKAIYSGLTTMEISRLIETILTKHPTLSGIWHVSSQAISKYDLLKILAFKLNREDIQIVPDEHFICDRSLLSEAFNRETGYKAPTWKEMLNELVQQIKRKIACSA